MAGWSRATGRARPRGGFPALDAGFMATRHLTGAFAIPGTGEGGLIGPPWQIGRGASVDGGGRRRGVLPFGQIPGEEIAMSSDGKRRRPVLPSEGRTLISTWKSAPASLTRFGFASPRGSTNCFGEIGS